MPTLYRSILYRSQLRPQSHKRFARAPVIFSVNTTSNCSTISSSSATSNQLKMESPSTTASGPSISKGDIDPSLIPKGYQAVRERNASILLPAGNVAFLNPIQEYNRDLSVAVIKTWMKQNTEAMETRFNKSKDAGGVKRFERKRDHDEKRHAQLTAEAQANGKPLPPPFVAPTAPVRTFIKPKYTVLEALSATGLRSIRYAQELEAAGIILANDMSSSAVAAMKQNVHINNVLAEEEDTPILRSRLEQYKIKLKSAKVEGVDSDESKEWEKKIEEVKKELDLGFLGRGMGKKRYKKRGVVVNEGDANALMYSHTSDTTHVDVVDLDPYGTAAPFIDAAVQSLSDGGLLCVTCTDLAVLSGTNYPEKCFSNYGGSPAKAEYHHEASLRLVLNTINTSAARYGRHIVPLVALSIDFYVRIFVRIHVSPAQVKFSASRTGLVYVCSYCQNYVPQPFGRVSEIPNKKAGQPPHPDFKFQPGPPLSNSGCVHCASNSIVAGPMWLGSIQDPEFISKVLSDIETDQANYGTYARMKGMLTIARDELTQPEAMFYFTPAKVAGTFHCQCPKLETIASALYNAGYEVSRSHTEAGSIKTNAPRGFVYDIFRKYIEDNPVRKDKLNEGSPAIRLLEKESTHEVDLTPHPKAKLMTAKKDSVRYQLNPTANWGPATRAKNKPQVKNAKAGPSTLSTTVATEGNGISDEVDEDEPMEGIAGPSEDTPGIGPGVTADVVEAAELGLALDDVIDPAMSEEVKDEDGVEVNQLRAAEEVVEEISGIGMKRTAEEEAEEGRVAKKSKTLTAQKEEEMMNM